MTSISIPGVWSFAQRGQDNMMEPKSLARKPVAVAAVTLLALATLSMGSQAAYVGCTDTLDGDDDGLSDCAEILYLSSSSELEDTDADDIPDAQDLLPATAVDNDLVPISVMITKFSRPDRNAGCEPNWGNQWDPYIGAGSSIKVKL